MARRPKVAVARWEDVPGERLASYWRRLREAGLEPVDLCGPAYETGKPSQSIEGCAGLLLTGGVDIDPRRYGEAPHPDVKATNAARDAFEEEALKRALAEDMPVLAICRGHQLLNIALGGGLLQHIDSGEHVAHAEEPHESRWHAVAFEPDSRLRGILGVDSLLVNSRHHQAVTPERLAPGLRIAARSEDGLVEAVESPAHRWVVGVQWHPEREESGEPDFDAMSRRLFHAFALALNIQMSI